MTTKPFNLSTWDGFSDLPREGTDYLLDTAKANQKYAFKQDSPYRWHVGNFRVPKGATGATLERVRKDAGDRFVVWMGKEGWTLASKLDFRPHNPFAYDLVSQVPILDREEWIVRGIFKLDKGPQKVRYELPPTSVREDPEQVGDLATVARGEGIRPRTLKERQAGAA